MRKLNPYYIFNIVLIIIILLYSFYFSSYYPNLSINLIIFLAILIFLLFVGEAIFNLLIRQTNLSDYNNRADNYNRATFFAILGTLIEGIYSRGFPLFTFSDDSVYGIPVFHVFLTVFISFVINLIFLKIINSKNNFHDDILIIINLICLFLGLSRSVIVITLLNSLWLFLLKKKSQKVKFNKKILLSLCVILGLYAFGLIGNYRSNLQLNHDQNIFDSSLISQVGGNPKVANNKITGPFFWDYIYITSPLANLQNMVNNKRFDNENTSDYLMLSQILPDTISNRLFPEVKNEDISGYQINSVLTVGTVFYRCYYISGWLGLFLMILYMMLFPIFYILLINYFAPEYLILGIAFLNTTYLLNLFGNMFNFSITAWLLVVPFIFKLFNSIKRNKL